MKLFVNDASRKFVAQITLQPKCADTYRKDEPWLLLHNTGRVDRFPSQKKAKDEARKSWGNCQFKRSA